jgi:hypothetical protein
MANQKFSATEREAIWLAHEKKCAHTRELLDLSSLHIDHILPESLTTDPIAFAEARKTFALADSFDIFGLENLLPCKPGANTQKGAILLDAAPIHYFLGIASAKKSKVEETIRVITARANRGRALVLLQGCLERGELSANDVAKLLDKYSERPQEIFRLIAAMHFGDASEITTISKAEIETLRGRPIKLGTNDHIEGVTLINDAKAELFVRTCVDYDNAITAGYYPLSNFDTKMAVFFKHQCGLLLALKAATTPSVSFLAEPQVGITDLNLLPFSLFPQFGSDAASLSGTYQNRVDDGTLLVRRVNRNTLCVEEPEGMGQQLIEVARADFNEDGLEEILLFEYCYATHGTLGYGGIRMLTRKSLDGLLEVVSREGESGSGLHR